MEVNIETSFAGRTHFKTKFGSTALIDVGKGFPAIFIHGLGQSAYFWRFQLSKFKSKRRCIAFDLMAHGYTEALPNADVSFRQQAKMILTVLDDMQIEKFDLVMNDSGGAVGQILAVMAPDRVRTMVFSNCDVHDNWPPQATLAMREAAKEGIFSDQIEYFIQRPELFHTTFGALTYEDPTFATADAIIANVEPIVSSIERKAAFNKYVGMQDHDQLVEIENDLRRLQIQSLILWGTADPFFPTKWAYWLQTALPLALEVVEIEGAKLFFPEERAEIFNKHLTSFWEEVERQSFLHNQSKLCP